VSLQNEHWSETSTHCKNAWRTFAQWILCRLTTLTRCSATYRWSTSTRRKESVLDKWSIKA